MEEIREAHIKSGEPEARIAMCKCKEAKGRTYGVRFQRDGFGWKYTWAFKMNESSAKREGYNDTQIMGNIEPEEEYPGCPYCKTKYFVVCGSCQHLNCNISLGTVFTCEWCGHTGVLGDFSGDGIASGGDRG